MRILVTSGGTEVPIDPVRSITNRSTGTSGVAIVQELYRRGHEVHMLRARHSKYPRNIAANNAYVEREFRTFDEYHEGMCEFLAGTQFDAVVCAAAVSDYGCVPLESKVRSNADLTFTLHPLPKVIKIVKELQAKTFLVGYKMLTIGPRDSLSPIADGLPLDSDWDTLRSEARASMVANNCDAVVGNYWKYQAGLIVRPGGSFSTHYTYTERMLHVCDLIESAGGR
jgi:phosphopantothenoylcysteine synthetase/decarboxylase